MRLRGKIKENKASFCPARRANGYRDQVAMHSRVRSSVSMMLNTNTNTYNSNNNNNNNTRRRRRRRTGGRGKSNKTDQPSKIRSREETSPELERRDETISKERLEMKARPLRLTII